MTKGPGEDRAPGDTWRAVASRSWGGADYAREYADRFDRIADEQGAHGEVDLVASLLPPGARVLDAGCGHGRVAARLAQRGFTVAGVDVDASMIEQARRRWPGITWWVADLAETPAPGDPAYDAVVMAGNVVPFVEPSALQASMRSLADRLVPDGLLVAGFGLARSHLPDGAHVVDLAAYDDACASAGLVLDARFAGWDREPLDPETTDPSYAVSLHRRRAS